MAQHSERDASAQPGAFVRQLLRRAGQAALASALARDGSGHPYASLVLVAVDHDASPLLLISDLSEHSRNLAADARASLLIDATAGFADPLAGPRATVLGSARPVAHPDVRERLKARFLARHPSARTYAGFADFRLYRLALERAHLVAGFGRIHWLEAGEVLFDAAACAGLAAAEPEILAHMNTQHGEALNLIAAHVLGPDTTRPQAPGWVMTGLDPEGFDLRAGTRLARVDFERPVGDTEASRAALVELAGRARRARDAAEAS